MPNKRRAVAIAFIVVSVAIVGVLRAWRDPRALWVSILLILAWAIWVGYWLTWTGFGQSRNEKDDTYDVQRAKTLWDWMSLLIVPILIAAGGLWFNDQQTAASNNLAADKARNDVLDAYIDRMSDHILSCATQGDEVHAIAQARTLTALQRLDDDRKGILVRFLGEAKLIQRCDNDGRPPIALDLANLSRINLSGADLHDAELSGQAPARLQGANLSSADMHGSNLQAADLRGANLQGADLHGANLQGANLQGAKLDEADLYQVNLSGSDLAGASLRRTDLSRSTMRGTNLQGADLRGADLSGAYLYGVALDRANLSEALLRDTKVRSVTQFDPRKMGAITGSLIYQHIFLIMLENHSYQQIIGNRMAPRINALARMYGLATAYYGVAHPSELDYLATIGGSTFGFNDQKKPKAGMLNGPSLPSQLKNHRPRSLSWKFYQQSMRSGGDYASSTQFYSIRFNPFAYFTSIYNDKQEFGTSVVPFTELASDLQRGAVPNVSYIVPDFCNDMHGIGGQGARANPCPSSSGPLDAPDERLIRQGDRFVDKVVQQIINSPTWTHGNTAIVVTWDEDDSSAPTTAMGCCDSPPGEGGGHIPTIVMTNHGPRGVRDGTAYNHYSLLRTIQDALGLSCLHFTCDRARVKVMTKLFIH